MQQSRQFAISSAILFLLGVILLVLGPACDAPEKPKDLMIGVVDLPRQEVIEGVAGSDESHRVPLSDYDKSTAFKPKEWEKVIVYIHEMEDFIKSGCGK
jgi:hypothetical protein